MQPYSDPIPPPQIFHDFATLRVHTLRSVDRPVWDWRFTKMQKWDPLCENVPVTDPDRERILKNIRDAFRSQGFEIDVI